MKVGDLVIYMGHSGIILNPVAPNDTFNRHWHVWFFDSATYIIVYEPFMKKVDKLI